MNPDELSKHDGQQPPAGKNQPATSSGATDLFGIAPSYRDTLPSPQPDPSNVEFPTAAPAKNSPLPTVHTVVFNPDSSRLEETDSLLNLLRSSPPQAKTEPLPAPVVAPPPAPAQPNGGFTQLLRALNFETAPPEAPRQPDTRVLAAQAPPSTPAAPPAPPPVSMPQVTSFRPQPQAPVSAGPPPPTPSSPGSFTQMFQALNAAPGAEPANNPGLPPHALPVQAKTTPLPDVPSPSSFTQMLQPNDLPQTVSPGAPDPSPAAVVPKQSPLPAPSQPGSFTQMFRALDSPGSQPDADVEKHPPVAAVRPSPVSSSQAFDASAFRTPQSSPVEQAAALPHAPSFTQMFATPQPPPPVAPSANTPTPGSFTQMFQAISSPPQEVNPAPAPASPGSFTQMFKALDAEPIPVQPPSPAKDAGSFTQLFQSISAAPKADIFSEGLQPSSGKDSAGSSNWQAAQTPSSPPPGYDAFSPRESLITPTPRPPQASGGLTQLLRALDQPAQQTPHQPPSPTPVSSNQPGTFTSTYGALNENPDARTPQQPPPAPAQPPTFAQPSSPAIAAGPSEFTRILNASALREAALHGGGSVTPANPLASGIPPAAAPPAGASFPSSLPSPAIAVPRLPEAPKPPQIKMPDTPKVAAAGTMQQYLPLLLIVIIFLLVIILVAVLFLKSK